MRWLVLAPLLLIAASAPDQKTFLVSGFERVRVDGPYQVDIVRGPNAARAEGDPKALDQLDIHVDGSTLVIDAGTRSWETRAGESVAAPHVMLSTPLLSSVTVNGGGTVRIAEMRSPRSSIAINGPGAVTVTGFDADELNAAMIGAGTLTITGTARRARVRSNGAATFDGSGFTANDAVLISESSGGMRLGVRYTAQVMALGIGTVHLDGAPECTISGSGPVECAGRVIRR